MPGSVLHRTTALGAWFVQSLASINISEQNDSPSDSDGTQRGKGACLGSRLALRGWAGHERGPWPRAGSRPGVPMPYVKNTYIEPKLFYAIIGLAVSNLIAFFVMLAVLAADSPDAPDDSVAVCRERYPYTIDGSDDEHNCEAITAQCRPGIRKCVDDPTLCLAVLTMGGSDESNQAQACFFTPASRTADGAAIAPPPPQQLTCVDYDQRAGLQEFPCPLTPGTEAAAWLSTAPILRSDASSVNCPPSNTHSCSFAMCCTQLPAPLSCSNTMGNGESFNCRLPWTPLGSEPGTVPVISSYNLDPTAPCDRDAGGCTPFDCCTIPPTSVEQHVTTAETYPSVAVRWLHSCCSFTFRAEMSRRLQVERFYEGLDTKNVALMQSKVDNGYQVRCMHQVLAARVESLRASGCRRFSRTDVLKSAAAHTAVQVRRHICFSLSRLVMRASDPARVCCSAIWRGAAQRFRCRSTVSARYVWTCPGRCFAYVFVKNSYHNYGQHRPVPIT